MLSSVKSFSNKARRTAVPSVRIARPKMTQPCLRSVAHHSSPTKRPAPSRMLHTTISHHQKPRLMTSPCPRNFLSNTRRMFTTALPTKIGVIGAGQMGTGIAKVAAHIGKCDVLLMDASQTQLDKSAKFIDSLLKKDVQKEKISQSDSEQVISRIARTDKLEDMSRCQFVIEAATENPQLKFKIFRDLDQIMPPEAILASNTSSISITAIGGVTKRPEKVVGMHFMNPVPVMKLVEIIPSLATSKETLDTTVSLAQSFGKTITTSKDMPGFIANRLLCPYLNEAFYALQENLGTPEDIDTTMKLGTNVPMGPLTLADFIGLDTVLAIMRVLHNELGDAKYRPCPLLVKYVEAGWLGKKTGRGVFQY